MKFYGLLATCLLSSGAFAAPFTFQGSDTLAGIMTDAIQASGLQDEIQYVGGGSSKGEKALISGQQGIAPMSRAAKSDAIAKAAAAGIEVIAHPVGLDGLGVFVNKANTLGKLSLPQVKSIFTCEVTDWSVFPSSGLTGPIQAFRRDDVSGTTDTFKSIVGVKEFGSCVTVMAETADIAAETASNPLAIGYSGLSATRENNRPLTLSKDDRSGAYLPTVHNVRKALYPLARTLYVYEAKGSYTLNTAEAQLLTNLLDRSFLDPIVQQNDFITLD